MRMIIPNMPILKLLFLIVVTGLWSCNRDSKSSTGTSVIEIGFLDAFEDETLAKARQGFIDALNQSGYENDSNIHIKFLNAQGDIPTLTQACQSLLSGNRKLLATNSTMATITACKQTKTVPVFMMVAPRPDIAGLTDKSGNAPSNLFGTYETLFYIDTSVAMIHLLKPEVRRLGLMYNQAETQSQDAFEIVKSACAKNNIELVSLPVNNSAESKMVAESLIAKGIDAFFALPDNVIFASFETLIKSCDNAHIPVFTSEAGLVARGAVASYGADFYQWGFQTGKQAALFLASNNTKSIKPTEVKHRARVINEQQAIKYGISIPPGFEVVNLKSQK